MFIYCGLRTSSKQNSLARGKSWFIFFFRRFLNLSSSLSFGDPFSHFQRAKEKRLPATLGNFVSSSCSVKPSVYKKETRSHWTPCLYIGKSEKNVERRTKREFNVPCLMHDLVSTQLKSYFLPFRLLFLSRRYCRLPSRAFFRIKFLLISISRHKYK